MLPSPSSLLSSPTVISCDLRHFILRKSSDSDPPPAPIPRVSTSAAYGILLFTMVIWASAFAGLRFVLRQIDPMTMTALRLYAAATVFLLVAVILRIPLPQRKDWPSMLAAAVLGFTAYHYLLNLGTETITAGQASFIIATIPIWTAMLAWRFLGERLTVSNWLGLLLGLAGVGIMSVDPSRLSIGLGSWLVLGAALCAAGNLVITKDLLVRYRALDIAVYAGIIGALPYLLHLPWTWPASAGLDLSGWLVLLYLGIIPVGLGYWLSSIALAALPASRVAQMLLLIPPMAAMIAWITIGEPPSKMLFVGGPLIIVGVILGRPSSTPIPSE